MTNIVQKSAFLQIFHFSFPILGSFRRQDLDGIVHETDLGQFGEADDGTNSTKVGHQRNGARLVADGGFICPGAKHEPIRAEQSAFKLLQVLRPGA